MGSNSVFLILLMDCRHVRPRCKLFSEHFHFMHLIAQLGLNIVYRLI